MSSYDDTWPEGAAAQPRTAPRSRPAPAAPPRTEPVQLVDFARQKPEPPRAAFVPCSDFEQLRQASPPPLSAEEALQKGLAEGEARGRAAAQKELAPALQTLQELAQSLAQARAERIVAAEQDLLDVAAEIARRILHGELHQGSDSALRMARACIDQAKNSEGPLVLRVCAADAELLRAHLHELELDLAERELQLQTDAHIESGGVVLETRSRCYEGRPQRVLAAALARTQEGAP